jgi:hypothetical protein
VQVMKPLIMQFSATSYYFIPPRSKCSQHLLSNTFSLSSSLNVRDQVSHPSSSSLMALQPFCWALVSYSVS